MSTPVFNIHNENCLDTMKRMEDNSVDAIVSDPPAGIAFMGKEWDKDKGGRDKWIEWMTEVASNCMRVLKPGGHALVWSIPRTSHWTATAWENAGFETRDCIYHVFGSGFPKSMDVSKQIDKIANAKRTVVGKASGMGKQNPEWNGIARGRKENSFKPEYDKTAPATPEAQQWEGFGTALKPAVECWWLLRKPLSEKTIAANVLKWGTGAINIDGCRVGLDGEKPPTGSAKRVYANNQYAEAKLYGDNKTTPEKGRFPANFIHDGSQLVLDLFPETQPSKGQYVRKTGKEQFLGAMGDGKTNEPDGLSDKGSAARFFYCAKASKKDRDEGLEGFDEKFQANAHFRPNHLESAKDGDSGKPHGRYTPRANNHPTVKPSSLMRYLCRLITPPDGLIYDPFTGSGSTGKAAMLEGFNFIGSELEKDYCEIAEARIKHVQK